MGRSQKAKPAAAGEGIKLGVNIDHVATVRQARRGAEPDPVWAAAAAELAGADGITVHLREDRRHIQDRDVRILRQTVRCKLNLEMAVAEEIVGIALELKPDQATVVPERRQEVTTEGGLEVRRAGPELEDAIRRLRAAGIQVNLFIDPDVEQVEAAKRWAQPAWNCIPDGTPWPKAPARLSASPSCSARPRWPPTWACS